ncbi:MAG: hypothetical protein ACTSP5_02825 [Candidatus Heimdallarchaeota archaeon]
MKFEKLGKERENVTIEIGPFDFGNSNIIKSLDNTLGYIQENKPEILQEYLTVLTGKLREIINQDFFKGASGKLAEYIKQFDHLTENYDLLQLLLSYFVKTLGVTEEQFWENKKQEFSDWNFFCSVRDLQLVKIKVLVEILGKEEAIDFSKGMTDSYIVTYDQNQKGWYKDLEEMRFHHSKFIEKNTLGRVRLLSEVKDGQYIEVCLTCDKVRNYPNASAEEKELLDVTGCYCHHALTSLWNDNFKLTLTNTLAKGDPYCTYVYHDTRIVDKIEEPTKEFFDAVVAKYKD